MKYFVGFLVALSFIGLLVINPLIAYNTRSEVSFTVKDKDRVCSHSAKGSSCQYLIFTDGEVYADTDSLWYWKWNSSDVYGSLDAGKTYTAEVYGFRVPFLSWYKNIIKVSPQKGKLN